MGGAAAGHEGRSREFGMFGGAPGPKKAKLVNIIPNIFQIYNSV